MAFSVYILFSHKLKRFYVGTTDDVNKRFSEHNSGRYPDAFSSRGIPWVLFLVINNLNSNQAYNIERHIKAMKSSKYILNLKKYPDLLGKLIEKYQ